MSKDTFLGIMFYGALILGGIWWWNSSNTSTPTKGFGAVQQNTSGFVRDDDPTITRPAYTGDKDCGDFDTQSEAQDFFEENGGPDEDPHNLDRDGDGVACETLP